MPEKLTIVVGGYIVAYPLGGMTWHHLNYLLGLQDLGHEVYFLEDSGTYCYPFDPAKNITTTDPQHGLDYLKSTFARYGLPPRYHYYSEFLDRSWGMSADEMNAVLSRADLLLYVSGVTPMRESRPRPRRTAVIDTDPVFTQLRMSRDPDFVKYYQQFDQVFTFGKSIGTPACQLPTHGFHWIGTNQPIALKHWPVTPAGSRAFTTIGKWEQANDRRVEFNGQKFSSGKSEQWMKMMELPGKVPWEMSLGQLDMPADIQSQFHQHGWKTFDPKKLSESPKSFADFLTNSAGEFTVAKEIYAGVPSGWFSDRSAAYLASGRPVVTQATGFENWLPTGKGLFSFANLQEAADSLNKIAADYAGHSTAARRIAEEFFDSRKVLTGLLEQSL